MAIKKVGGKNPNAGKVTTTMGLRDRRPPLCMKCGERRPGQLYSVNANGQEVCADCAGDREQAVLAPAACAECDPDEGCSCVKDYERR